MNNYQMFRKIQERDNIIKRYSNDTKEDLIDLVIEKDNIIDNLQFKIDKAIEYINNNLTISSILDGKKTYCLNDYSFNYEELLNILKEDK